jgi:hypothetical protein
MNEIGRQGFWPTSLGEVLVLIAIVGLMLGLLLPMLGPFPQRAHRTSCANNLSQLWKAMMLYAEVPANNGCYPTTGSQQQNGFNGDPMLSLQLLLKSGKVTYPELFYCPGKKEEESRNKSAEITASVPMTDEMCSYGYDPGHTTNDEFAIIMADANPDGGEINSRNHNGEGQNMLRGDGNVIFRSNTQNAWLEGWLQKTIYSINNTKNFKPENWTIGTGIHPERSEESSVRGGSQ